jgi:uncharacterized membrane protein
MDSISNQANLQNEPRYRSAAVTLDGRYLAPPQDDDGKLWVRTSAIIQADAMKLYGMWTDLDLVPQWQEQMVKVIKTGAATSHWMMRKANNTLEWDAEVLADEPGKRLAWRSTGGDLTTAGEVIFEPAPAGQGTMVTVLQEFTLGKLANLWESLTGRNPKQAVIENLRHFKALAETGEIPRTQAQPHGPRGVIGKAKAAAYGENIKTPPGDEDRQAS